MLYVGFMPRSRETQYLNDRVIATRHARSM
jgi:hypothetical protein